jgi:hypothetical protein
MATCRWQLLQQFSHHLKIWKKELFDYVKILDVKDEGDLSSPSVQMHSDDHGILSLVRDLCGVYCIARWIRHLGRSIG